MYLIAGDVSTREGEQTICSTKTSTECGELICILRAHDNSIHDAGCAARDQKLCLVICVVVVLV